MSCPIVRVSDTEYFLALEDMKVGEGFLKHVVTWFVEGNCLQTGPKTPMQLVEQMAF